MLQRSCFVPFYVPFCRQDSQCVQMDTCRREQCIRLMSESEQGMPYLAAATTS